MVQRSEEEHDIGRRVTEVRRPRIARFAGREGPRTGGASPPRFRDGARRRMEQMDGVASLRQPQRVRAGRSADVDDDSRRRRRETLDQFPRANRLEDKWTLLEAVFLRRVLIVI